MLNTGHRDGSKQTSPAKATPSHIGEKAAKPSLTKQTRAPKHKETTKAKTKTPTDKTPAFQ